MAKPVLYRVCYGSTEPRAEQKSRLSIRPAILHGYLRHRVKGCDYPAIVASGPSENDAVTESERVNSIESTVRGTMVTGLTDGDIWRLDIFEGDQYTRMHVDVHPLVQVGSSKGEGNVEAAAERVQTYVWTEEEELLEEGEWDFADFVKTKMARWTGSVEEYEEVDEAVKTLGDDPTGGRGNGGAISERLHIEGGMKD